MEIASKNEDYPTKFKFLTANNICNVDINHQRKNSKMNVLFSCVCDKNTLIINLREKGFI